MTPQPITTRRLLDAIAESAPEDGMRIDDLLEEFRQRAFGLLLLISTLPLFVPLPVGTGAIAGPLVMLVGLQLLAMREQPWLPAFLARRRMTRSSVIRFRDRLAPWLGRLERLSRPRAPWILERRPYSAFTGLLLVLVGFLAALPIPMTNYPFGVLLALFAIALVEKDGALMVTAWALTFAVVGATVLLSNQLLEWLARLSV